jgi:mono/diheme cytochrome c family protein
LTQRVDEGDQAVKLFLSFLILLLPFHAALQEPQKPLGDMPTADSKPPPAVTKQVNPVKPTPNSLAIGKKAYTSDCAMCHGKDGAGGGELAVTMNLKLRDYRDLASLKDMTDGEIYSIISNGKGQMTGEAGRMKAGQIWDVVNYIRSLSKK